MDTINTDAIQIVVNKSANNVLDKNESIVYIGNKLVNIDFFS